MNPEDLCAACPGVDFSVPYKSYNASFSIGDYVLKYLQKTFDIIKSYPRIKNEVIVDFVRADFVDADLPLSKDDLVENLKCSNIAAEDFLLAQSAFFDTGYFKPLEYKKLGLRGFVPFRKAVCAKSRSNDYGVVERVFDGQESFARKIIGDSDNLEEAMMEMEILKLATDTGNPHLLRFRCGYEQDNRVHLIMYPWCDLDLSTFLKRPHQTTPLWIESTAEEKMIRISNWMACLASGLSALHNKKIKHLDIKPENVLLDADLLPVICDFGLSKAFEEKSRSNEARVRFQDTRAYWPPERLTCKGEICEKTDIFSLGLVFLEIGLFIFGRQPLSDHVPSGCYSDIRHNLDDFLEKSFSFFEHELVDSWISSFRRVLKNMLQESPDNRPEASEVWDTMKTMVEIFGVTPHCTHVMHSSTTKHDNDEDDEENENTETRLPENFAQLAVHEPQLL